MSKLPSLGKAMAIGYYPRGCLQGGVELPVDGPNWQVMRLSRNRNWGHPELIRFLEKIRAARRQGHRLARHPGRRHGAAARRSAAVRPYEPSDRARRRHLVHAEPDHQLSKEERENISASNLVAADGKHINPKTWTPSDIAFIKTAAEQPEVERVLVNAAIKKELCRVEDKKDDGWMDKVRPWYGHDDHIHVRLKCPADSPNCRKQPPVPGGDGCGKELDYWFSDKVLHPKPSPSRPSRQRR